MTAQNGAAGEQRAAIVTGGRRGIGKGIALALAADGFDIAIADVSPRGIDAAVAEIAATGRRCVAVLGNVALADDVARMVAEAEAALGRVDALINNAGVAGEGRVLDISPEDWDRVMGVNARGTFLCSKAVLPGMMARRWGRIVSLSSIAASGYPGLSAHYVASKAAISAFTKTLAQEVGEFGITVNAVAPGHTLSEWVVRHRDPAALEQVRQAAPLRRLGTPADIADTVAFLCSERGGFITGQTLQTSGGQVMLG